MTRHPSIGGAHRFHRLDQPFRASNVVVAEFDRAGRGGILRSRAPAATPSPFRVRTIWANGRVPERPVLLNRAWATLNRLTLSRWPSRSQKAWSVVMNSGHVTAVRHQAGCARSGATSRKQAKLAVDRAKSRSSASAPQVLVQRHVFLPENMHLWQCQASNFKTPASVTTHPSEKHRPKAYQSCELGQSGVADLSKSQSSRAFEACQALLAMPALRR